jgi:AMP-activated protein kinase-like protein
MATVVPVTFCFPVRLAPAARNVSVVGSFNGWNPTAHRMRRATDAEWVITVYLPPSRAVYLFCVDDAMWLDPEDEGRLPNGWGSEYSVRHVVAGAALPDRHRTPPRRFSEQAVAVVGRAG